MAISRSSSSSRRRAAALARFNASITERRLPMTTMQHRATTEPEFFPSLETMRERQTNQPESFRATAKYSDARRHFLFDAKRLVNNKMKNSSKNNDIIQFCCIRVTPIVCINYVSFAGGRRLHVLQMKIFADSGLYLPAILDD